MGDERWEKCQRRRRRRRKRDPSVRRISFFLSVFFFCLPAIFLSPYFICLAVYLYSVPLLQRQPSPCPPSTANLQAYKAPVASVSPFSSRAHIGKCYNSLRSLRRKAFQTKPSRHFHGTLSLCLKSIPPRFSFFYFLSQRAGTAQRRHYCHNDG